MDGCTMGRQLTTLHPTSMDTMGEYPRSFCARSHENVLHRAVMSILSGVKSDGGTPRGARAEVMA